MNDFHRTKKSAAVLKHAIIDQYSTPFISKTGSTSLDNRVAFIDGYAGPGRYEDGTEGSGSMLLRKAKELASFPRTVECHFVEKDPEVAAKLRALASTEGVGVTYTVDNGDVSTHLPALLTASAGIPLFTYLDPCGLIMPLGEVASIFSRPAGFGAPATEVLINLTAHLRRFGGMLNRPKPIEASLRRIDDVCGGEWWREAWLQNCNSATATDDQRSAAEAAVVTGYAERLRQRAGNAGTWVIPVRPRADLRPVYYLIFATRHVDGMIAFGESASLGLEKWRRYLAQNAATGTLFDAEDAWEHEWNAAELTLKSRWTTAIAERISRELALGEPFRIIDKTDEILGELVGVARSMHIRAALRMVLADRRTTTDPKGVKDLWRLRITPV